MQTIAPGAGRVAGDPAPSGHDALAVRASKKLRSDELLLTGFAGTSLQMELDRVPLWRGNHVAVKQLVEDFARYLYLPRLKDSSVLVGAVRDGLGLLTWEEESFAFADSFDELTGRYRGLRGGQLVSLVDADSPGLLVKGSVARSQLAADSAKVPVRRNDRARKATVLMDRRRQRRGPRRPSRRNPRPTYSPSDSMAR